MKRSPKCLHALTSILLVAALCQPVGAAELMMFSSASHSQGSTVTSANTSVGTVAPIEPNTPASDPLYTALYGCIDKGETRLRYSTDTEFTEAYLNELLQCLLDECPEFFYLYSVDVFCTIYKNPDGSVHSYVYEFVPIYTLPSQKEIAAAKSEWTAMLDEILSIVRPEMSDLEKALVLHDYLCINFGYDVSLSVADSYTFLLEKKGICEAYADTYSALLTAVGIENCFAVSISMNHVWNVLKIDGEWYHVDVTWDDPMSSSQTDQPGKALHTSFLRSDKGMKSIDYMNWDCKVTCTSEKYDNSLFSEINSEIVSDGEHFYAVSNTQKAILRCDFDTMTAEPIVDLSSYRWYVWGSTAYWNACYANLYCDGERLYFSTPTSIEAYDLASGLVTAVCQYEEGKGYLYSMRYVDHHLVCTVGTKPSAAEGEFSFQTPHRYGESTAHSIFTSATCVECEETDHRIVPLKDTLFAVTASTRETPQVSGYHDIRIVFAVDQAQVKALGQLEYCFELLHSDGSKDTLLYHSNNDQFDEFVSYSELSADGQFYRGYDDQPMYGFFVSAVKDKSWTQINFTVQDASGNSLHTGALNYDQLMNA